MYWPYDEVSLELQPQTGTVAIKSPWLQVTAPQEMFVGEELAALSMKLNQQVLGVDDLPLINRFFSNLDAYPFTYTLPSLKSESKPDQHALIDKTLLSGDMREVFEKIVELSNGRDLDLCAADISDLFDMLPRTKWQWDSDAALQFARVENRVHPESLFSVAKRYHLLEIMSSDAGNEVFRGIRQMDDENFKIAARHLVRQNHYVTLKCQGALEPAILTGQSAREQVLQFQKEEHGHDKLLERALREMGERPENLPVSLQTKALMLMLETCARHNFLAFSMAVDAFERSNYAKVDPLAELLASRGFNDAAKYINAHMNINDHGEHENIAKKFLFAMDLVSEPYALEALRLLELLSVIMCSVSRTPSTLE